MGVAAAAPLTHALGVPPFPTPRYPHKSIYTFPHYPYTHTPLPAAATDDFDVVAALQSYVHSGESIVKYYSSAEGGKVGVLSGGPISHEAAIAGGSAAAASLSLTSRDTLLSTVPLHTSLGFSAGVLAPLLSGSRVLWPSRSFNAAEVLECATVQRPTKVLLANAGEAAALGAALAADKGKGAYDVSSIVSGALLAGGPGALGGVTLKAL